MEKITLTPQPHEIIVNNGSLDGAVDLFSYAPESEEASRTLGSLYVIGHRDTDSSNISYIVSLVAALARREYYAQPGLPAREAFGRMLRKVNEIVDEFFKSADVDVSIGIFAIAGSSILVSKLDKFKILLAREGQTIDILNNVALFSKEHLDKRRFSSIISGSVQPGDRILAYYPSKSVTTRERYVKSYLTKLDQETFTAKMIDIGRQHPTFTAAMLCVNMVEATEAVTAPSIQPKELTPTPEASQKTIPPQSNASYAWAPRQAAAMAQSTPAAIEPEPEVPHIIPTEFSLGTRRSSFVKWFDRIHFVRLDTRGKAIFVGCAALIIISGVLMAKSALFEDPAEIKAKQTIQAAQNDLGSAKAKLSENPLEARHILTRILANLNSNDLRGNSSAEKLTASILQTMDTLDNAQLGSVTLVSQLDPKTDQLVLAQWSSASQSLWAVVKASDDSLAVGNIDQEAITNHVALSDVQASILVPFQSGVLVIDTAAKSITRIKEGVTKLFTIPTQDTILSAVQYEGALYLLTDQAILKISDLGTNKPVTKQWLTSASDLAPNAKQLLVDGSIWTLSNDGILTSYYKGKKANQVQTTLQPSGRWQLLATSQAEQFAIANNDTKRIYIIDTKSGDLVRTIKIDTEQTIIQSFSSPDNFFYLVFKDNKIWKVQ